VCVHAHAHGTCAALAGARAHAACAGIRCACCMAMARRDSARRRVMERRELGRYGDTIACRAIGAMHPCEKMLRWDQNSIDRMMQHLRARCVYRYLKVADRNMSVHSGMRNTAYVKDASRRSIAR